MYIVVVQRDLHSRAVGGGDVEGNPRDWSWIKDDSL